MKPPSQPQQPFLSQDLQLEVIARTDDVATVIRCAAASKPLRRSILDLAFRRSLAVIRAATKGGFDPALLTDVSYRIREHGSGSTSDLIAINTARRLQIDTTLLVSFEPACSLDGILVLWRHKEFKTSLYVQLLVCNVFTGDIVSRPPEIDARGRNGIAGDVYRPALLTVEEGQCQSFKLIVMNKFLQIRTLSSPALGDGKWDHVYHANRPPITQYISNYKVCTAPAAVIGSTAHWLCHLTTWNPLNLEMIILAVTVNGNMAESTMIQLPDGWGDGDLAEGHIMLAATTTDDASTMRLGLLIAEPIVISMWTLITHDDGYNGWSRQVRIHRREIRTQLGSGLETYQTMRFKAFGKRSGTVVFWIERVGLVKLNLVTKKAVLVRACSENSEDVRACLHEIDVASLLCGMKPF